MKKIILETPFKGALTLVHCAGVTVNALTECNKNYIQSRGLAISYGNPIPCRIEYLFDTKKNQVQSYNVLEYEK